MYRLPSHLSGAARSLAVPSRALAARTWSTSASTSTSTSTSPPTPTANDGSSLSHILILDFEATCEQRRPFQNEIIEFPTLIFDLKSNTMTDTFHEYVRPVLNPKLTEFCTDLTGIQQSTVDAADTFVPVWYRFLEFLSNHGFTEDSQSTFIFLTCGDWDFKSMLPQQIALSNTSESPLTLDTRFQHWLNVKTHFGQYYGKRSNRGMESMLSELGLELEGRHHSGIDDCKNIAKIVARMLEDGWDPRSDPGVRAV